MSLGFSAVALPALKLTNSEASWFGESRNCSFSWFRTFVSFSASIASIATPIGCFVSGPLSDKFGRKSALLWINVVCLIGWVVIATAQQFPGQQYPVLLIGRVITGLSTGLASMPASVYMAEISSSKLRGVFTTWNAIFFSLGILLVYALGFCLKDNWSAIAVITACFPAIGLFSVLLLVPESPSWLISKNRIEQARENLCKIYGVKQHTIELLQELEVLVNHKDKTKVAEVSYDNKSCCSQIQQLSKAACLKPFILVLTYFFFQQFSGSFVVVFYAIDIVEEAGVTMDPYFAIVTVALTRFFSSILVSFLSKKFGRRPLSIVSGAGMTLCMITLALYLFFVNNKTSVAWLPITLLIAYFFTSTLGFLTMPFAMAAECFPGRIRGTATGLITCIAYIFNFVTVKVYPDMVTAMGSGGVFCFYGGMALLGTIFIVLCLPETKGKTLQEIEEYFGGNKV